MKMKQTIPTYKVNPAKISFIVFDKPTDTPIDIKNPKLKTAILTLLDLNLGFKVTKIVRVIKKSPQKVATATCHLEI